MGYKRTYWSSHALLLLFAVGCLAATPATGQETNPAPIELSVKASGETFATRGRALVTHDDIDNYLLQRVPEEHRSGFLIDADRIGTMVENLALPRQLAVRAMADGLDQDAKVQAKMLQGLVTLLADEYMARYFEAQALDDYEVVARELYLTSDRKSEGTLDFSQILIVPDESRMLDSLENVTTVAKRVRNAPEEFDEIDLAASASAALRTDRRLFTDVKPPRLNEAVRDTLLAMDPGEISGPVQSQFGWHILRLEQYHAPERVDFEEVREQFIAQARAQHRERVEGKLLADLQAVPLEITEDAVRKLLARYDADFGALSGGN